MRSQHFCYLLLWRYGNTHTNSTVTFLIHVRIGLITPSSSVLIFVSFPVNFRDIFFHIPNTSSQYRRLHLARCFTYIAEILFWNRSLCSLLILLSFLEKEWKCRSIRRTLNDMLQHNSLYVVRRLLRGTSQFSALCLTNKLITTYMRASGIQEVLST